MKKKLIDGNVMVYTHTQGFNLTVQNPAGTGVWRRYVDCTPDGYIEHSHELILRANFTKEFPRTTVPTSVLAAMDAAMPKAYAFYLLSK
jgi:hypothetical protein